MNEPALEHIGDYHTLAGEKRRTVWAVIVAGLLIGVIFAGAKALYSTVDDELPTSDRIGKIPVH
jgi:hypothetical protein